MVVTHYIFTSITIVHRIRTKAYTIFAGIGLSSIWSFQLFFRLPARDVFSVLIFDNNNFRFHNFERHLNELVLPEQKTVRIHTVFQWNGFHQKPVVKKQSRF
jgi:hypothetical protein